MDPITIISLISAAVNGANKIIDLVQTERARLKERGEWTDAQEAAYKEGLAKAFASAAWQPSGLNPS